MVVRSREAHTPAGIGQTIADANDSEARSDESAIRSFASIGWRRGEEELRPGSVVGEYRIEGKLGEGGMGIVYRAIHPVIAKQVAVKVIRRSQSAREDAERFAEEARIVNAIGHQGIVDIFGFGNLGDGRPYYIAELLEGESLADRISRGPIPISNAADVIVQASKALDAAHGAGVVHRDLKPENLFVLSSGELKILDFGIAKLHGPGRLLSEETQAGMVMGTPLYMSPEQAYGVRVDHRSDVYSLGVVAFEMLCGHPPFWAESAPLLMLQHAEAPAPALGTMGVSVPPAVEALVAAMLEKDRERRPSLEQVRAVLEAETAGVATAGQLDDEDLETLVASSTLDPVAESTAAIARRRTPIVALFAVVVALVAAGGWVAYRGDDPARSVAPPERSAGPAVGPMPVVGPLAKTPAAPGPPQAAARIRDDASAEIHTDSRGEGAEPEREVTAAPKTRERSAGRRKRASRVHRRAAIDPSAANISGPDPRVVPVLAPRRETPALDLSLRH